MTALAMQLLSSLDDKIMISIARSLMRASSGLLLNAGVGMNQRFFKSQMSPQRSVCKTGDSASYLQLQSTASSRAVLTTRIAAIPSTNL